MLRKILILCLAAFAQLNKVCALPYQAESDLCKSENKYLDENSNLCCSKCPPGTGLKIKCTQGRDSICEPCEPGSYNSNMGYANCFKCRSCREDHNLVYTQKCTSTTEAICSCREGWYCRMMNLGSCKTCIRYSSCPPGSGVLEKGTQTSNVKCKTCDPGTYSDKHSNTQQCQRHADCTSQGKAVLHHGNSTADTVCGSAFLTPPTPHVPNMVPDTTRLVNSYSTPPGHIELSQKHQGFQGSMFVVFGIIGVMLVLTVIIIAITLACRMKGGRNTDLEVIKKFLPAKEEARHPSCSSSSSQSESSHGVWVGPVSMEKNKLNVSFTTTINLHQGASTQAHPIPPLSAAEVSPGRLIKTDSNLSLSQEEMLDTLQKDGGMEVPVAVQESGKAVC
ncbi:tumor necrosis factor receptor superfamily member 1B [Brienomyrus brachyistius]|uniref:tumor necrosis factor receptor superfamily member 1B n=1 Tax=Brienomyrus brachyistius TaxID=42636 RepID=UPI0020B4286B|nr:tumor necrosis factor receptor superfamily member 1B [Brienomyrus brachyistius]XP_048879042.1 tumor necrosis factor receptor superfamily member 1B [Brienomyrus brachyistius]